MDPNVQDSIVARLKEATNVLVTVSNNPSVDQLAACIGFTLLLNKIGKRGAAVFSGAVPSTLEFLQPDKTIEKNTDSLRDFIIALDKAKADKLRYKVEDKVVKIFITPYRTSISDKDLDFSQGDFNVDVVLALGVHEKTELDQAIVSHGRILHDATVISVNNKDQGSLGTLNWVDLQASSLSEMMASIGQQLGGAEAFDNQIATALMTGIVAETDRFSNEKTSPATMKLASELMGAGANQQLIASKLQEPAVLLANDMVEPDQNDDGELTIEHEDNDSTKVDNTNDDVAPELELPEPQESTTETQTEEASLTEEEPAAAAEPEGPQIDNVRQVGQSDTNQPSMTLEPPKMGGKLTANSEPEHLSLDPSTDPLSVGANKSDDSPILSRASAASVAPLSEADTEVADAPKPATDEVLASTNSVPETTPVSESTLPALDSTVGAVDEQSAEPQEEKIEDARDAVDEAIQEGGDPEKNLEPIQALGAQPVNLNLGHDDPIVAESAAAPQAPLPPLPPSQPTVSDPLIPQPAEPEPTADTPLPPLDDPLPPSDASSVSMPPTPLNTPPTTAGMPGMPPQPPDVSSLPTLDAQPPLGPSPAASLPPLPGSEGTMVPPNLMPPGQPTETSGASGPATPPPPVPPPMMPQMPPAPTNGTPLNPNQPL